VVRQSANPYFRYVLACTLRIRRQFIRQGGDFLANQTGCRVASYQSGKVSNTVFIFINILFPNRTIPFRCGKKEKIAKFREKLSIHVASAYQQRISFLDETVRNLDAHRFIQNWHFPKFFIFKETLAFTFHIFKQYDQALLLYEEMESLMTESFFAKFVPNPFQLKDLSFTFSLSHLNPFSVAVSLEAKESLTVDPNYFLMLRKKFLENNMTLFEFRFYLLYRQIDLLLLLENFETAFLKTSIFLTDMSSLFFNDTKNYRLDAIHWFSWRYYLLDLILNEISITTRSDSVSPSILDFSFLKCLYVNIFAYYSTKVNNFLVFKYAE
jgi:hypothetical protein